ncbi:MAG: hypothetical protein LBH25_02060 [Fibromonadaceae bacterium]|nr:hypothetical protein [Fibromonadaceae bacterium]
MFLIFLAFTCVAFAQKNASKNTKEGKSVKGAKGAKEVPSALNNVIKGKFTDSRDKKQYKTVKLGGRVWMAEDLNYKGKLYDFESAQNACPVGWRLPSKSAWEDLKKEISEADAKLKAKIGWSTQGKWWAATSIGIETTAYYTVVNSGFGSINQLSNVESANLHIRCIQNIKAKPSEKKNDIKQYKTVKIGSQLWMAENLNYKTGKSWCFENDDYNCDMYGRLYDWNTAAKACPSGWHLPTRREWNEVSIAEFSAMLGGNLGSEYNRPVPINEYKFLNKEISGNWWGITEYGNNDVYSWHIKANENELNEKVTNKSIGYSVRCVQNIPKTDKTNDIKQYKTVKIGNQVWMAENLNYKIGKSWCFEDDDFYCKKYGRLYDWSTATKVCPVGWHLPSDEEWNELGSSAGKGIANAISAIQGGWRDSDMNEYTLEQQRIGEKIGRWRNLDENGIWWTSTIVETIGSAQVRNISSAKDFSSTLKNKSNGLSVRCIQNPQAKKISKTFTDARDSKQYGVIVMGNTIWMKDNLNYNAKGSLCYDNKPENCDKYGRLYDGELAQTVCPDSWRLPSHEDWLNLIENSGNNAAGKKLKSSQQWNGTDDYGFSALPGGFTKAGGFSENGDRGYWWTNEVYGTYGKCKYMSLDKDNVTHSEYSKSMGFSVRCVQDCGKFNCVIE